MRPHHVVELVFGPPLLGGFVGEEDGGGANPEEAVGDEHGFFQAVVGVLRDVLGADAEGVGAAVELQHVLGEVESVEAGAGAHPAEVEALDAAPQLVLVDDDGWRGRAWD